MLQRVSEYLISMGKEFQRVREEMEVDLSTLVLCLFLWDLEK